jgi:hypothetical protein
MKPVVVLSTLFAFVLASAPLSAQAAQPVGTVLDPEGVAIARGAAGAPFPPTLDAIQANVFTPICAVANCHDAGQMAGLDLRAGYAYASIVGVPSFELPSVLRVAPYDPDASFLVCKLEACPWIVWMRMPPPVTGPPLDPAVIQVIRDWISLGAPETAVSAEPGIEALAWGMLKARYR